MSIGITQLIILIVIGCLLFGNLPKIIRDLGSGIKEAQAQFSHSSKSVESTESKSEKPTMLSDAESSVTKETVNSTPQKVSGEEKSTKTN